MMVEKLTPQITCQLIHGHQSRNARTGSQSMSYTFGRRMMAGRKERELPQWSSDTTATRPLATAVLHQRHRSRPALLQHGEPPTASLEAETDYKRPCRQQLDHCQISHTVHKRLLRSPRQLWRVRLSKAITMSNAMTNHRRLTDGHHTTTGYQTI